MTLAIKEANDMSEKRLFIDAAQRCLLRVDWAAEGLWTDGTMEQVFHNNHILPEVLSSLFSVPGFRPFRETLFAAVAPETRFGTWRNNQYLALFTSYDPAFVERARLANQASYLLREGDVEVFCKTFTEDNLSNALLAITPRVDMNQSQQILWRRILRQLVRGPFAFLFSPLDPP